VNGTGNAYRSDGVDLEATTDTGGGYDVGWTGAGQWFKYTVNVATAGTYTIGLRVAAPGAVTDGLHVDNSSGTNLSGNVNVPATGGYQDWTTVNATVTLPAGTQTLTVDQDAAGWNLNYLTFANSGSTGGGSGINTADWYEIVNQNSGLCESAAGGGTTTGTAVEQLACTGATSQLWQFVPEGTSGYEILNENAQSANEAWYITGAATTSGALVELNAFSGAADTSAVVRADSADRWLLHPRGRQRRPVRRHPQRVRHQRRADPAVHLQWHSGPGIQAGRGVRQGIDTAVCNTVTPRHHDTARRSAAALRRACFPVGRISSLPAAGRQTGSSRAAAPARARTRSPDSRPA
jgi:hypothetical protein